MALCVSSGKKHGGPSGTASLCAQVAQSVEQRTENPCVGGSIPPLGTIEGLKSL